MSTHPYIPLYVDDYEAATAHLSAEEDGIYSRLLRLCWRTPGCSLPDDADWIARKIRLSSADFERAGRGVLAEFFTLSRGRFVQRRLKREYDDISRKKSARKVAGKKGGIAKAQKTQEKSASNANVLPADTRAFHIHTQNHIDSEANASGDEPPNIDPDAKAWAEARTLLVGQGGVSADAAGKFFGKLLATHGVQARDMLGAINEAFANRTNDPQGWLTGAAKARGRGMGLREVKRVGWV